MERKNYINNVLFSNPAATGKVDYPLSNDYMFRMILQSNQLALKGFISALVRIPLDDINEILIENPIMPGKSIEDKSFVLDMRIKLNDARIINLEMQVVNQRNWPNRSLSYLCRTFDNLQKGNDYKCSMPVTHVSILDYDLFKDDIAFYSTYQLMNTVTGYHYNDNFTLKVLSLNQVKLATDDDMQWNLIEWAKLFKANTWEDIKMLASSNETIAAAANSLYVYNTDSLIREQCEAREEALRHEAFVQAELEERARHEAFMQEQLDEKERHAAFIQAELDEKARHEAFMQEQLDEKERHTALMQEQLDEKERHAALMQEQLDEKERHAAFMQEQLDEKERHTALMQEQLDEKEQTIAQLRAEIERLKNN